MTGRMTQILNVDLSVGLLDMVEAVFDRRPSTASFYGFHLPIENVLPEYTEVRNECSRFIIKVNNNKLQHC
jgi:hypothetical protein